MILSFWAYKLPPYTDESLSSWLTRNAHAHGLNAYRFCERILPKMAIWNRDIDRNASPALIDRLSELSGVQRKNIQALTFCDYRQLFLPSIKQDQDNIIRGSFPLLLNMGIYHRKRILYGQQFCPECLRENAFFKKKWRYGFVTYCPQHDLPLMDCCMSCGAPVVIHRAESIIICFNCGRALFELTDKNKQSKANAHCCKDYSELHESHSPVFLSRLNQNISRRDAILLLSSMVRIASLDEYNNFLNKLTNINFIDNVGCFEKSRIKTRNSRLLISSKLLENWPIQFHLIANQLAMTQRVFARHDQPAILLAETSKLPTGRTVKRKYQIKILTPEVRRLKKRKSPHYRVCRAKLALKLCEDCTHG